MSSFARRLSVTSPLGSARASLLVALMLPAGCSDANSQDAVLYDESDLTRATLTITTTGASRFSIDDARTLTPSARGPFQCGDRYDRAGVTRVDCERGSENLEVLHRAADKRAVVVHRPEGRTVDKRVFFDCKATGAVGPLPGSLSCTQKKPRTPTGHGGLASPFPSTISGLDIPNAHTVGQGGRILRGMAPAAQGSIDDLVAAGVGAVLVFKNPTGNGRDVADELQALQDAGFDDASVLHVPFVWKDLPNFERPCKDTMKALRFIEKEAALHKVFFHCTVGEDRTGYLAAIHRMMKDGIDAKTAFEEEMCERGYGAGNPLKPYRAVVAKLDDGLTPLFAKMAFKVQTGQISATRLTDSVCSVDPATDPAFARETALAASSLRCKTATAFRP